MRRMVFLAVSIMVLWTACIPASGQELKPLKSFDNEAEYLKYNFENGKNSSFNGRGFGELMKAVEAKLITAKIYYDLRDGSLFMYIYLQDPDYVNNKARLKETHLTGISVLFEEDDNLKKANRKVFEAFPKRPATVVLTKENLDKLSDLLRDVKIRKVFYEDIMNYVVTAE